MSVTTHRANHMRMRYFRYGLALLALVLMCTSCAALGSTVWPFGFNKLMVFGGPSNQTYLGCLNCSEYSLDSVLNEFGSYGNRYSTASILNSFGQFGSRYSQYSACNPYATNSPVIVHGNGNYYGRLTLNPYNLQQTRNPIFLAWLTGVCAS